jgi:hypothetical protein
MNRFWQCPESTQLLRFFRLIHASRRTPRLGSILPTLGILIPRRCDSILVEDLLLELMAIPMGPMVRRRGFPLGSACTKATKLRTKMIWNVEVEIVMRISRYVIEYSWLRDGV